MTQAQIGALLFGLRMQGQSIAGISATSQIIRSNSTLGLCQRRDGELLVDMGGTAGDCSNTFKLLPQIHL